MIDVDSKVQVPTYLYKQHTHTHTTGHALRPRSFRPQHGSVPHLPDEARHPTNAFYKQNLTATPNPPPTTRHRDTRLWSTHDDIDEDKADSTINIDKTLMTATFILQHVRSTR